MLKRSSLWLFLSAITLLVGCHNVKPNPIPVPPKPTALVGVTLSAPIAGVHITFDGQSQCDTDGGGKAGCYPVAAGNYFLKLTLPDGYVPDPGGFYAIGPDTCNDVNGVPSWPNCEIRITVVSTAPPTGIAHESGFLHTNGVDIYQENGARWTFAGYAAYTLLSDVRHGLNIDPFLDEAASYGANTIVVLATDLGDWAHQFDRVVDPRDPQWATWMAVLYDRAAEKHLRVALGVFQQVQSLSDSEKQAAWRTAADVARGRWNAILYLGNEDNVNGWDHSGFPRPDVGGVLLSTGSRGIDNPPTAPNWDVAFWEPRRQPYHKAMDDAGSGILEMHAGYPGFAPLGIPIIVIEPPFFHDTPTDMFGDSRWTSPADALRLGLEIGVNSSGGAFGSSNSLLGWPNGPVAAECARQFFRGLLAGSIR